MRNDSRSLWRWLAFVVLASFTALGWMGREIYLSAPPIPQQVIAGGEVLYTGAQIERGKEAWLAAGGQQLGSVWGHGSYVAPDWSADWLHREAVGLRDRIAQQRDGVGFERGRARRARRGQRAHAGGDASQQLRSCDRHAYAELRARAGRARARAATTAGCSAMTPRCRTCASSTR